MYLPVPARNGKKSAGVVGSPASVGGEILGPDLPSP